MFPKFLSFPIAGQTPHFLVTFADEADADALARAQAILSSCEDDLKKLQVWFNCNYDDSPYGIWVHVSSGVVGGGANNYGYEDDESSRIGVSGTPPATGLAVRDEVARMLFVAELAEVLMDFTGLGWDRGASAGEALSRIAAAELHPAGYYSSNYGPYIAPWLQSSARPDWVSNTEDTDENVLSYGCGILFINYLVYQLGFSIPQVVQAGGSTLAETFARLTGQPATDAIQQFETLLRDHIKQPQLLTPATDNIFPLLDEGRVGFLVDQQALSSTLGRLPIPITLKPGPICPAKEYTYHVADVRVKTTVKAVTRGFASVRFDWSVGGVPLTIHGLTEPATVNVSVNATTPTRAPAFNATLDINYLIQDSGNTSTLQFWNTSFPGNADVDITVTATEAQSPGHKTVHTENWPLTLRRFDFDPPWAADVKRCNPQFVDISILVEKLGHRIFILGTLPDPTPEQWVALAAEAGELGKLLDVVSGGSAGLRPAVLNAAGSLRASVAPPAVAVAPGVTGGLPLRVKDAAPPPARVRGPGQGSTRRGKRVVAARKTVPTARKKR